MQEISKEMETNNHKICIQKSNTFQCTSNNYKRKYSINIALYKMYSINLKKLMQLT